MSTLYCAVNRRTGTRGLPRHTMTEANLEFFLLKDSQDWYVVPVDLPPPPSEEEQQKFLAQIQVSLVHGTVVVGASEKYLSLVSINLTCSARLGLTINQVLLALGNSCL